MLGRLPALPPLTEAACPNETLVEKFLEVERSLPVRYIWPLRGSIYHLLDLVLMGHFHRDGLPCSFSISSGRAMTVLLRSGWVRITTCTSANTA